MPVQRLAFLLLACASAGCANMRGANRPDFGLPPIPGATPSLGTPSSNGLSPSGSNTTNRPVTPNGKSPAPSSTSPTPSLGAPTSTESRDTTGRGNPGPRLGIPEAFEDIFPKSTFRNSGPRAQAGSGSGGRFFQTSGGDPFTQAAGNWSKYYRSVEKKPIETMTLGDGRRKVLLLASLHGNETETVGLVERFAEHLRTHPELLAESTVLVVRSPNPDGAAKRTAHNSRGVDLNRNFPTTNWKTLPNGRAGANPSSEPETRAVMGLLSDFRPHLLVHVKQTPSGGYVNAEGNVVSLAEDVAQPLHAKVLESLGKETSGSVEAYALTTLRIPSLTLLLPKSPPGQPVSEKSLLRAFTIATLGKTDGPRTPGEPPVGDVTRGTGSGHTGESTSHPTARPTSSTRTGSASGNGANAGSGGTSGLSTKSKSTPTGKPASQTTKKAGGDFPAPIPDRGFLELPPPPSRP